MYRHFVGPVVCIATAKYAQGLAHSVPNSAAASKVGVQPAVRFGVVADIQYVNIDDGFNYSRTVRRHYRGALDMVDSAVDYWRSRQVGFVCQLGDIIDGQCKSHSDSEADLKAVLAKLGRLDSEVDVINLIGNHELYNFDREQLAERLNTA